MQEDRPEEVNQDEDHRYGLCLRGTTSGRSASFLQLSEEDSSFAPDSFMKRS
jgi:hypothetical protein